MSKIVKIWALAALCVLVACEQQKVEEPVLPQEEPFTFTAVAGPDTRVSAEFGDTENIINFKWSEDDSLFVCFVETDTLAAIGNGVEISYGSFSSRWKTHIFKLKSGAGSSRAVFQSVDLIPGSDLKPGIKYTMAAVYRPGYEIYPFNIWGNQLEISRRAQIEQIYDPDDPLANIVDNIMLGSYPTEVTMDSNPEIRFGHGMTIYRIKVNNTGSEPLSIQSLIVPGGREEARFYAPSDIDGGNCPGYFGETRYTLTMRSPVSVAPGQTKAFFVAALPSFVPVVNLSVPVDYKHVVNLTGGKSIVVQKSPSILTKLYAGRMHSTTLSVRADMATDGEIPPIQGSDEDDL